MRVGFGQGAVERLGMCACVLCGFWYRRASGMVGWGCGGGGGGGGDEWVLRGDLGCLSLCVYVCSSGRVKDRQMDRGCRSYASFLPLGTMQRKIHRV